jgi:hypothetical protein
MSPQHVTRRGYLRRSAAGLAAGTAAALAGCSGPEEDGNDSEDGGGGMY